MVAVRLPDDVVIAGGGKIILVVLDGLGGIQDPRFGKTELQVARTPNLDKLASESTCGLLDPIMPGISPGSGPAHMALFGYEPLEHNIGRGVLSALGVDFALTEKDLAARANFATLDPSGNITDRRAGRISSDANRKLCEKLGQAIRLPHSVELFIQTESEHRAVVVFRGEGLSDALSDTDPQKVGVPALDPSPLLPEAELASEVLRSFLSQAADLLKKEHPANAILLRGFAVLRPFRSFGERFKLKAAAVAKYPMYRGLARLIGMEVLPACEDMDSEISLVEKELPNFDFFYLHVKKMDSHGEDGNFEEKVKAIELVDRKIPSLVALSPDVLVVTADHSTPSLMKAHSWHPVPVLLRARTCRVDDVASFDELSCARGGIGRMPTVHLMSLALAHAGRLTKYGA
ncbi:MAG: 2,3-bisphosphoglycerate-independent phosphoglycerate mutase [Candidatus Eiseniibacteriota bacterium]|nr:MAG: 2,3-bisphosphoglycerate-independent phosphoglycerate mutase [Candidatus Eisenbacteria bacterium]